ncbi:hypothetical protein XENORESO_014594, partial [Xenotaenia resolanae]
REQWLNGHSVTVDYDTLDPLVRRDSFQDWTHPQTGKVPFILIYSTCSVIFSGFGLNLLIVCPVNQKKSCSTYMQLNTLHRQDI